MKKKHSIFLEGRLEPDSNKQNIGSGSVLVTLEKKKRLKIPNFSLKRGWNRIRKKFKKCGSNQIRIGNPSAINCQM